MIVQNKASVARQMAGSIENIEDIESILPDHEISIHIPDVDQNSDLTPEAKATFPANELDAKTVIILAMRVPTRGQTTGMASDHRQFPSNYFTIRSRTRAVHHWEIWHVLQLTTVI